MLLVAAAVVASVAVVSGANSETHVQRYVVNGKMIPQNVMEQAQAAAMSAMNGQQAADDRSLLLTKAVVKGIALKKIKKKKKKNPFKSPLKALPAFLPLLGLGGAAAAAASAGTAVGNAAKGVPPAAVPATYTTLPDNFDMPVWKVHKYNGIDIRPVRWSDLPLPPPSESDFPQVVAEAPKEVLVPEPVVETFPTPADSVVYPEPAKEIPTVYGPPAQVYGPPAQVYGPPAQVYGPPAQVYGPPAQVYGPPAQYYGPPAQFYTFPAPTFATQAPTYTTQTKAVNGPSQGFQSASQVESSEPATAPADEAVTDEGLEALSNLGALTDFLPGGGDSNSGLFGGQNRGIAPLSFFNRFIRFPGAAPQTAEIPATTTVFRQPSSSAIQNLLGRIPIISSLTNFGSNPTTHLSIPPLPELPALPDIANVRAPSAGAIPQIPHIRLPTKYVIRGSPYVTIRVPPQPAPVVETVAPAPAPEVAVPVATEPVVETVKPEPSYPLPLESPQQQPQFVVNSYGQPIQPVQTGYYVTPVIAGPAPQYGVPVYSSPVGKPASVYGLPGGDSFVAASEIDPTTSTDCADGKACGQSVTKVSAPQRTDIRTITRGFT